MKELTRTEEIVLLAVWRLQERAYGVAVKRKIKETTGKSLAYGTLYFILDRLTVKEYVTRVRGEPTPERGGRSKTYYRLTREGIAALKASLELHRKAWAGVDLASIHGASGR